MDLTVKITEPLYLQNKEWRTQCLIPERDRYIDLSPYFELLTLTSHPYIGRLEVSLQG
jgi:hypothetical protein